jgi:hypothetical protein
MYPHLEEPIIARRLRAAAQDQGAVPYDWDEFQRRAHRAGSRGFGRNRAARMAVTAAAAGLLVAFAIAALSGHRAAVAPTAASPLSSGHGSGPAANPDDPAQARTRELEGWLANLPRDPAVVRVGAHAAVTSLQDQIATLDDLMSAERAAGAGPRRLDALEQQRSELVSSLAQLRYAELLASSTP